MAVVQNVYAYRMPAGIPGRVNREQEHTGDPNQLDASNPPLAYGDPVKMGSNGRIQALAPGDTAAAIYGFLEAPFPGSPTTTYGAATQMLGNAAPPPGGRCTVMKRGYMTVAHQNTTAAAKGDTIHVRLASAPAGGRLSGLEAAADSTNTIAVPGNSYWMGAADSGGMGEIAFNI